MHKSLSTHAHKILLAGLGELPYTNGRMFRLMYGRNLDHRGIAQRSVEDAVQLTDEQVVAEVGNDKLDHALAQVDRTIESYRKLSWEPQTKVRYVPNHAYGDQNHPDCEDGRISSTNEHTVFVKFDKQVANLGWEGTTAQGCDKRNLHHIK